MGGNALKNTTTRRYAADEFAQAQRDVNDLIGRALPLVPYRQLLAYGDKESFGDMDVLIESDGLPPNWPNVVAAAFGSTESVKNGNVLSLNLNDLQVDLIATPGRYSSRASSAHSSGRTARKASFTERRPCAPPRCG